MDAETQELEQSHDFSVDFIQLHDPPLYEKSILSFIVVGFRDLVVPVASLEYKVHMCFPC